MYNRYEMNEDDDSQRLFAFDGDECLIVSRRELEDIEEAAEHDLNMERRCQEEIGFARLTT